MAELDLKDIWKKGEASLTASKGFDLARAIGKKSQSILQRIKLILWVEFWLNMVVTPAAAVVYYLEYGTGWAAFVAVVFVIYFLYYLFLIRSINRFDYSGNVKLSLTKVYKYLKFYVLHYKVMIWLCFLVIPWAALAYGFYIGATGAPEPEWIMPKDPPQFEFTKQQAYMVLAAFIIIPILVSLLFHFLVGLLYERKIKKLKRMIEDLD